MKLIIFGAQGIALGAYEAIHKLYPKREISCFLVTKKEENPETLSGIPVLELKAYANTLSEREKNNIEILIATPENMMQEIEQSLEEHGLCCHARLTSLRWAELMSFYHICEKNFMPLSALPVGCHRAEIQIFMAKFYKDKALTTLYRRPEWMIPIQVGAALCKKKVADIQDCKGDHISEKNVNYSELTALYWMWKNWLMKKSGTDHKKYYGLAHYRRILELSEDDTLRLIDNDIDVVLPYPMPYEPNIEAHHKRYLAETDWKALVKALEELQPEYAELLPKILAQKYLYNYNILLARKIVLVEYCEWLFTILERIEEISVPKGWERQDRYIGYMGETLETLYFMVNKERLNIAYAGCRFLT